MLKFFFIVSMIFFAGSFQTFSADIPAGKGIFQSHCTACHSVLNKVVGPALKDVDQRHDEKWLLSFIHSSQSLVKKGDPAAIKLFNDNGGIVMPDHKDLSDADILNVIAFIKDEGAKAAELQVAANTPINRPVEVKLDYTPISFFDYGTWVLYTIVVTLLVVLLFTLVIIKSGVDEYNKSKLITPSLEKNEVK